MKKLIIGYGIVFAICIIFNSCTKSEESVATIRPAETNVYTIPNLPPIPFPAANIPADPIPLPIPSEDDGGTHIPDTAFTVIENPTAAYIKETCLFDVSKMSLDSSYHQVNNKDINIAFFNIDDPRVIEISPSSIIRLTNAPGSSFHWPVPWNYPPYVEKESPDVLFCNAGYGGSLMTIVFSKPCSEFGVEISPNIQQPYHSYSTSFGYYQFANQMIKTPSGAHLFAVKSAKPFTSIGISYDINGGQDYNTFPQGYALANIRYKLAP